MENEIILGDCIEVMRGLPDGYASASVTDPPYNVGFSYDTYADNKQPMDYADWCREWFTELRRVVKGPILFSCGHRNLGMWFNIAEPTWVMAWHKPAAMGNSPVGVCNWEPLLLYGKPPTRTINDVIRAPIVPQHDASWHPCPKPVAWASQAIERLTVKGQRVLDPFCGSGTTAVAAWGLERAYLGIELDPVYFAKASARLREIRRQDCFAV